MTDVQLEYFGETENDPFIHVTPACVGDVDFIVARLSEQSRSEMDLSGLLLGDVVTLAKDRAARGGAQTLVCESGPLIIFGFSEYDGYYSMWSLSAQDYWCSRGVRASRRFFAGMEIDKPLIIKNASTHPNTVKWMALLGFELRQQDGSIRVFTLRKGPCI